MNQTRKVKSPQRKMFDKAWKECSQFIRQRDKYICYTCGARCDKYTSDAGHFRHGKTKQTYFDEDNIHAQCIRCNKYLSGNLGIYGVKLVKELGEKRVEKIIQDSYPIKIWKLKELEEIYQYYKQKNVKIGI